MLTDRQLQLLEAIINEYIDTSEPVGSQVLVTKYKLKYSPATVRNEMAKLIEEGFLQMLHTSSGRVPTSMAYRVFLENLMTEEELPVLQEVAIKQKLWPSRFEFEKMLRQATVALAESTRELAIATSSDGYVTHSGAVNVLDNKEFWDIEVARAALHLLDRPELLEKIFDLNKDAKEIKCVIGEEIGINRLEDCGIVFSDYKAGNRSGRIAILGPARMHYSKIIPAIRYAKNLIEELGGGW